MKGPVKILIVEDEVFIGLSLEAALSHAGFEITGIAASGDEAVREAAAGPDIILMDIHLAGDMDGLEAAAQIYASEKIPIIFMSGYADEYIQTRVDSFMPVAFLIKPVQIPQLIQLLNDTCALQN